jgi:hypothetical protein
VAHCDRCDCFNYLRLSQGSAYFTPTKLATALIIFSLRKISRLSREIFPEKRPGSTGNSLMTWEDLSGYARARWSPMEHRFSFTSAGISCKEVVHHVISNIVSLERDQPARWRSGWRDWLDSECHSVSRPHSNSPASLEYSF